MSAGAACRPHEALLVLAYAVASAVVAPIFVS
jgi:hypothetical protein